MNNIFKGYRSILFDQSCSILIVFSPPQPSVHMVDIVSNHISAGLVFTTFTCADRCPNFSKLSLLC